MDEKPLVSVVVTTKNEERNIENCLRSIRRQSYPADRVEIIVVDNFSTDRTAEISIRYTSKVCFKGPERSTQRNFGLMKIATGKYAMFLDADMELDTRVIERGVEKMEKEGLAGVYIPEIIVGRGMYGRVRNFERSFYNGTVIDCVRMFRRELLYHFGGFDTNLTGPEDWDFDKEIRHRSRVAVLDSCLYHNELEYDMFKWLKKKASYAGKMTRYIEKWGKKDRDVRRQLGFYYRFIGVFTENGKWKRLVRRPILAVYMYLMKVFQGIVYVVKLKEGGLR
jgi:glycosyltransferase involved in cell wall biosynthesis